MISVLFTWLHQIFFMENFPRFCQVKMSCYVLDRYQKLRNPRPPPVNCWCSTGEVSKFGHLKMGNGKTASIVTIGRKLFMMSSPKKLRFGGCFLDVLFVVTFLVPFLNHGMKSQFSDEIHYFGKYFWNLVPTSFQPRFPQDPTLIWDFAR